MGFCILKMNVGTTRSCNLFVKTFLSYPKKCLKWSYQVNRSERLCIMSSEIISEQLNATKMFQSLGFNIVSYDAVKVWFRKFKAGNFDIEDEPRSGRPAKVIVTSQSKSLINIKMFQHELLCWSMMFAQKQQLMLSNS